MRLALLLIAAIVCTTSLALAQNGSTLVAIVTSEPNSRLTRRLRAELAGIGVDVVILKPPDETSTSRAPLDQAARNVGAIAAIRLVSSANNVEVWAADRVTGKAVVRALDAPSGGGAPSDAEVAVGAVELLRASLMELHAISPPHGDAPATDAVRALALPTRSVEGQPALGLSVGGAAAFGAGTTSPSAGIDIGVWGGLTSHVGLRAVAELLLVPAHESTRSGSVDVDSQLFSLGPVIDLVDRNRIFVPTIGAGITAAHVSVTGTAVTPFMSTRASTWTGAPYLYAGVAWSFARGLRLRADTTAGWALDALHVRANDVNAGRWGAPIISVAAGLEILWMR